MAVAAQACQVLLKPWCGSSTLLEFQMLNFSTTRWLTTLILILILSNL